MTWITYLVLGFLALVAAYFIFRARPLIKFSGTMLVTCPENRNPAAVKVATLRATFEALAKRPRLGLSRCSRWPERRDCGQGCLCELEADPENHRVWSVVSHYYDGKKCVYCGKLIQPVSHFDHKPAFLNANSKTFEWNLLAPEKLPEAMSACLPVCWDCHILQTVMREHPDRVVYRRWESCGPIGEYTPKNLDEKVTTNKPVA